MYQKINKMYEAIDEEIKDVAQKTRITEDLYVVKIGDDLQINLLPKFDCDYNSMRLVSFLMELKSLSTGNTIEEVRIPLSQSILISKVSDTNAQQLEENTEDVPLNQFENVVEDLKGVIQYHCA